MNKYGQAVARITTVTSWNFANSLSTLWVLRALRSTIVSQKTCECESPSIYIALLTFYMYYHLHHYWLPHTHQYYMYLHLEQLSAIRW